MEGLSRGNLEHCRYQITTMEVIELQALAEGDPSLPAGSVPYVRAVLSQQNQEVHKHFDETFNWMPTTGRSRATQKLDADGKSPPAGPASSEKVSFHPGRAMMSAASSSEERRLPGWETLLLATSSWDTGAEISPLLLLREGRMLQVLLLVLLAMLLVLLDTSPAGCCSTMEPQPRLVRLEARLVRVCSSISGNLAATWMVHSERTLNEVRKEERTGGSV